MNTLVKTESLRADLASHYIFYPAFEQLTEKELTDFKVIEESDLPFKTPLFQSVSWIAPDGKKKSGFAVRSENWRYIQWHDTESGSLEAKELNYIRHKGLEKVNLSGRPDFKKSEKKLSEKLIPCISF